MSKRFQPSVYGYLPRGVPLVSHFLREVAMVPYHREREEVEKGSFHN